MAAGETEESMKYKKTPMRKRKTYSYLFENGDRVILSVGISKTILHDGRTIVSIDHEITEEVIKRLHRFDDAEVRSNLKAINCETDKEMRERLYLRKLWIKAHPGCFPTPYDTSKKRIRLDSMMESDRDGEADRYLYLHAMKDEDESAEEALSRVHEFVSTLPMDEQELYRLYYVEGLTYRETGEYLGISKNAVKLRLSRLREKIIQNFSHKNDPKPPFFTDYNNEGA